MNEKSIEYTKYSLNCQISIGEFIKGIIDTVPDVPADSFDKESSVQYSNVKIYKRNDTNSWYARWQKDNERYRVSGHSQLDVYNKVKLLLAKPKNSQQKYTLNAWIDRWREIYKKNQRDSTKKLWQYYRNKHCKTKLFSKSITSIKVIDLQEYIQSLPTTKIQKVMTMYLKDIFNKAYKSQVLKEDLSNRLETIVHKAKEKRAMSVEELNTFVDVCANTENATIFIIQAYTGMRPGEALALEWEDIDIENRTLSVTKSLSYDMDDTRMKTEMSYRTVPLFNVLLPYLKKKGAGRIFPYLKNAKSKLFKKIINQCNFDYHYTENELRHTFITNCQNKNVPEHILQRWVGHQIGSNITKKVYTHVLEEDELQARNLLDTF